MNEVATQEETQQSVSGDLFRKILAPQTMRVERNEDPAPTPVAAPQAEAPPQAEPPPAQEEVKAEQPAPAAAPAKEEPPMSAAELAVRNLVGDIPTTITWNDEAKKLFKETFGAEDPLAFKTDVEKRLAEAELNLADANDGRVYKKTVENMSPALQRAFQLELQGKKEEAIQYLRSMPDSLLQNKEAKSLTDKQLLDTYEPGQVSDEEWKAMETGNFDDLGVDERVLKHKVKTLRQLAERAHETKRASIQEDLRAQEVQIRQAQEMEQRAIAAAVAKAKNDPLTKAFITPQTIDQFASQQLLRDMLFDPSGVTSENQMTNLLKAKHFDEVMVAQKDYWYKKGLQDGAQEATAKVPSGPQGSGRAVASPPQQQPDLARSILQQVAKQA